MNKLLALASMSSPISKKRCFPPASHKRHKKAIPAKTEQAKKLWKRDKPGLANAYIVTIAMKNLKCSIY